MIENMLSHENGLKHAIRCNSRYVLIYNCHFKEVFEKAVSKTGNFALLFVNKLFSQNVNHGIQISILRIERKKRNKF